MSARRYPFVNQSVSRPPAEFAKLHSQEPVCPVTFPSGQPGWLVSRYDDVKRVLSDHRTFSRAAAASADAPLFNGPIEPGTMLSCDPPAHSRLRAVVARAFSRTSIARLEPELTADAHSLLRDAFEGSSCDLVAAFARPFPTLSIVRQLGIPKSYLEEIIRWSDAVMSASTQAGSTQADAFARLRMMFRNIIASGDYRHESNAILSSIVLAGKDGRLTEHEMLQMAITVLVAGHETSTSVIANVLLRLVAEPSLRKRVAGDMSRVDDYVRELLRTMPSGGGGFIRITTSPVSIAGVTLPAGAAVTAPPTAASLDPEVYPDPLRLDVNRPCRQPLTFGAGAHRCLGEHLALLQLRIAILAFLRLAPPHVRLAQPPQANQQILNRPLQSLEIRWDGPDNDCAGRHH